MFQDACSPSTPQALAHIDTPQSLAHRQLCSTTTNSMNSTHQTCAAPPTNGRWVQCTPPAHACVDVWVPRSFVDDACRRISKQASEYSTHQLCMYPACRTSNASMPRCVCQQTRQHLAQAAPATRTTQPCSNQNLCCLNSCQHCGSQHCRQTSSPNSRCRRNLEIEAQKLSLRADIKRSRVQQETGSRGRQKRQQQNAGTGREQPLGVCPAQTASAPTLGEGHLPAHPSLLSNHSYLYCTVCSRTANRAWGVEHGLAHRGTQLSLEQTRQQQGINVRPVHSAQGMLVQKSGIWPSWWQN